MNTWIYFNGTKWQVKYFDAGRIIIHREYATRSEAYCCSAWGICPLSA